MKARRRLLFPPLFRFMLCGYLLLSKPFAYLHVPGTPLFIGEVVLLVGLFEMGRLPGGLGRVVLRSPVLRGVCGFMALSALRLTSSLAEHLGSPLDAARDSAIWYYGLFALVVAYFATHDRDFTPAFLGSLRRVIPLLMVWAPFVTLARTQMNLTLPGLPLPLSAIKAGDLGMSCAIALTFVLLRLDRCTTRPWPDAVVPHLLVLGSAGVLVGGTVNRGGFLAGAVTVLLGYAQSPRRRRRRLLARSAPWLALAAVAILVVNPRFDTGRREISVTQLVSNLRSVAGGGDRDQSSTEKWRIGLWGRVVDDALTPAYLLEGQGFGPNVYQRYNPHFLDASGETPLRSPHNSHLNVLARVGVPGFALWIGLWLTWWRCWWRRVRRARSEPSRDIAVWLGASVTGLLLNAVFDPSLEGPQVGVWLWSLTGLGAVFFRTRRQTRAPVRS